MILQSSDTWKKFVEHVLFWETGYKNPTIRQGTSSDPRDTGATGCVPAGMIHTNKGVTFCTFEGMATSLGITPVTHARFLSMTNEEVGRFIYAFYKNVKGDKFSDSVGLSLAEAAWGSGAGNAAKHLQKALKLMGKDVAVDGAIGPQTIAAANSVDQKLLYKNFWDVRKAFLASLTAQPRFAIFEKGWTNRVNSFLKSFSPAGLVLSIFAIALIMGGAFYVLTTDKKVQKALENVQI